MLLAILISILSTLLIGIYYGSQRKFNYWKKKKIPFVKPTPFLGNYGDYILLKKNIGEAAHDVLMKCPNEPIVGAFYGTEPVLIIQDPSLVNLITIKDYYYFNAREISEWTHKEVMTRNMFFTYGDNWRVLRQNCTPLFSSLKMKNMFHLIEQNARILEKVIDEDVKVNQVQDVRNTLSRFTMDCICGCAFGIDTDVMKTDDGTNPFRKIADMIFDSSVKNGVKTHLRAIWPSVFYGIGLNLFSPDIGNFFKSILKNVVKEREGVPAVRQDFVDLMINLMKNKFISGDSINNMKNGGNEKCEIKVDDEFLVAQCILFFAAGFETSATTSSFALFELAKKPELQDKVLAEVDAYLQAQKNQCLYNVTTDLPYLDQCLDETLRLYPVLTVITREVYEDYVMPSGVLLEKGLRVHIPVYHLQRNPKYFPDPDEFDPDRFSPENKRNMVPSTYLPFGDGPRTCIGMRFAKMQMLAGLVALLKKYRVELAEGMPEKVEYSANAMVIQSKTGINLKLIEREGWQKRQFAES